MKLFAVTVLSFFLFNNAFAQAPETEENKKPWAWGITTGQFLPFGIEGVDDNYTWHGVRLIRPVTDASILYSFFFSQAKGVSFYNFDISFQLDYEWIGFDYAVYLGFDINYYKRQRTALREYPFETVTGGHIGWAILGDLGKTMRIRFDIKNKFGPARSAYIGVGLEFDFGASEDGEESPATTP